jgi:hypothetical protein
VTIARRLRPLALVLLAVRDDRAAAAAARFGAWELLEASTTTERSEVGATDAGVAGRIVWHHFE